MDPLWIMLVGMLVVIGGVLVFRLHAFLALTLAAILVAALTPASSVEKVVYDASLPRGKTISDADRAQAEKAAKRVAGQTIGERVAAGFGRTCTGIGILIAMAAIVGKCLLDSGAADRIVRSALWLLGEARAGLAFLFSGFLLGIPVFFDTVFYLMIPLGKAMTRALGKNYLLYILSITAGATMTHSLVPPTPGPLFVANELGVNLGLMMLGGGVVGIFASASGYLFALWANRRWVVPLRDTAESPAAADPEEVSAPPLADLPPLWLAVLPILLPVILISGDTVLQLTVPKEQQGTPLMALSKTLGNKDIALSLAALVALATLVWQKRTTRAELAHSVQGALSSAGTIILITAAGGAFGATLQQTGIGDRIKEISQTFQIGIIPLAFVVAAMVRTAQGSATVAMMTSAGILGGVVTSTSLPFNPLYVALAIGCGSKPVAWMNDSGFWVICKMSGMTEKESLRTITPLTGIMGCVGLVVTMIGARLFPLV